MLSSIPSALHTAGEALTTLLGHGGWKSCSSSHPLTESHSSTTLASTDLPLAFKRIFLWQRLPPLYQPEVTHLPGSGYGHRRSLQGICKASGYLPGTSGNCKRGYDSDCCQDGKMYPQYRCSPPVTGSTRAQMNVNCFAENCDGGGPSECDSSYHSDDEMVVALSIGWYSGGSRCHKNIRLNANGKSVLAKVVDECDSVNGCDEEHDFQPPCPNNVVDASPSVWRALGIDDGIGFYHITWSDE